MKKLAILTSVLALTAVVAGCSGTNRNNNLADTKWVQTHQDADVTRLSARIFNRGIEQQEMGRIAFTEREEGLQMRISLRDVRPNTEYTFRIFEATGCPKTGAGPATSGKELVCRGIMMPTVRSDADGRINATFMTTGITAADLEQSKISLVRMNADGTEFRAAWGTLRERGIF
ncbi:MAG: hypothetical protein FWG18_03015 [Alphaproteobacteria bacterium]|nr:hypothetical protein [Alphaproteobacteria bacterium]